MSNRSRRVLFLILLLSFFIIGVPLALYSYGYRLDINRYSVSESGGIFVRSLPGDAVIKIDGEDIKNESGILNVGTFVRGLSPKKYLLSVSRDGYRPIDIIAEVRPFKAASFDKLILIPETDHLVLSGKFSDFIADSGLMATEDEVSLIKFEDQTITGQKVITFTSDNKSILTRSETGVYLLTNLAKPKSALNISEVFWGLKSSKLDLPGKTPITAIIPHPYEANKFLISTRSSLYLTDIKQGSISMIGSGTEQLLRSGNSVALVNKNDVSLYNFGLKSINPLISTVGAKQISFSKEGQKMAILWKNDVLEIYDMREKRSLRFPIKNIYPSGRIEWHKDENHLFISGAAGVYFLEIDNEVFKPELIIPYPTAFNYADDGLYFIAQDGIRQLRF